jgi:hypothetical protein
MSITTRGFGNQNITTSGWGYRWRGPVKKIIKNFILYITRLVNIILGIKKEKLIELYIERNLTFNLFVNRVCNRDLYITREIEFELQVDPKEI